MRIAVDAAGCLGLKCFRLLDLVVLRLHDACPSTRLLVAFWITAVSPGGVIRWFVKYMKAGIPTAR